MFVREFMTRPVLTVRPETTIQEAARKMRFYRIGLLPVSKDHKILGVITDRDIAVRGVADARHAKLTSVQDIMTTGTFSCRENHDIEYACSLMEEKRIRRLLVTDGNNRLVGIISVEDIATRAHKERLSGQVLRAAARAS